MILQGWMKVWMFKSKVIICNDLTCDARFNNFIEWTTESSLTWWLKRLWTSINDSQQSYGDKNQHAPHKQSLDGLAALAVRWVKDWLAIVTCSPLAMFSIIHRIKHHLYTLPLYHTCHCVYFIIFILIIRPWHWSNGPYAGGSPHPTPFPPYPKSYSQPSLHCKVFYAAIDVGSLLTSFYFIMLPRPKYYVVFVKIYLIIYFNTCPLELIQQTGNA